MKTSEVRGSFLEYFAQRGHTIVPSASLVPDDPTLLFTTAGMVQFKPYFEGRKPAPYPRAASVQKCFRTPDLEIVGTNSRNLTFFEMLGNFSFGDYFKKGACEHAWEFVTETLKLEADRIWITVFETDDEAYEVWRDVVGVPQERILRRTAAHGNFWDMGVAGPCGPCSELLYDRGPGFGEEYRPGGELDEERYLEIWNLVFMQDVRDDVGAIVGELPSKNIDTGMGLERVAAVMQDVPTTFEVDVMVPIMRAASDIVGTAYGQDPETDVSLRVMTEHARSMAFVIADGVMPSNEHRGYVLRRLIRRAVRYARKAGVEQPFLPSLTEVVIGLYAGVYPELERNRELVSRIVEREESRFDLTLRQGLGLLEAELEHLERQSVTKVSGEVAFKLHDTYGFPLDLTQEIAREEGVEVDVDAFATLMAEQRERARSARKAGTEKSASPALTEVNKQLSRSSFVGYDQLQCESTVAAIISEDQPLELLSEGSKGSLVLPVTTFYAESGGQVADRGLIRTPTGIFEVEDVQKSGDLIVHGGRVRAGEIVVGQEARTDVDATSRQGSMQSHTATHILHWALRELLGEHARQQGSLVEPGRLRFDFSHFEAVAPSAMKDLDEELNLKVVTDDLVTDFETSFDEAMELGAMALFGEKYGDVVRVVQVGEYSRELCGGTHVSSTGQIGVVKLISEGSVAAGTRRVEALTGMHGLEYLNLQNERLSRVAEALKVAPDQVLERIEKLQNTIRDYEKRMQRSRDAEMKQEVERILASEAVSSVEGSRIVALRKDAGVDELRELGAALVKAMGSGAAILGAAADGRANLVTAVTKDLNAKGLSAGDLVAKGSQLLGGGGGGRPNLAVGGGPDPSRLQEALDLLEAEVRRSLGGG